jgi:hypothetical protein
MLTKSNKLNALQYAFYRQNAPNLSNLAATVAVVLVVIYVQVSICCGVEMMKNMPFYSQEQRKRKLCAAPLP